MKSLIEFYEKHYAVIAGVIAASLITAVIAFSPLGDMARRQVAGIRAPDDATGAGFIARVENDWGVKPNRFLHSDKPGDLSKFAPLAGDFAKSRKAAPMVYSRDVNRDDAILIVGAFDFPEGLHGAMLVSRKGEILHRWPIPPHAGPDGDGKSGGREDYRIFPHGFALFPDGSAVIAFDAGERLIRIDACGNELWKKRGGYHHVAVADPDHPGEVWVWNFEAAVRLRAEDGEEVEAVRMPLVEKENPELDLFGVRQQDGFSESRNYSDPIHHNDVDPLPAALAPMFPQFKAGDLLVSARSLNLVYVVDRETKKIKWHASGYWRRQHDPDWGADGRIYVFNNNMNRGPSSIVAIDPKTMKAETVIDGAKYDFYTNIRGKQAWTADGRVVFVSPLQGRALEIDDKGEVSFDFRNRYDDKTSLVVSEAFAVPAGFLDATVFKKCEG